MKWKAPQYSDIRIIKTFLFIPLKLNYEYRWLETAYIEQLYRYHWFDVRWSTEEEYLKFKNK